MAFFNVCLVKQVASVLFFSSLMFEKEKDENHIQLKSITEENLSALWSISYGPKADLEWKKWDGPFQDPILTWEEFKNGFGKIV